MQTWQSITASGTIDDLLADAHTAGHPEANARLIHAWISKGLLGSPRLRTHHRGSDKAEHSANQRNLFLVLLDKRRQQPELRLNSLAQVPLALWLWWDGEFVSTRQAQKAFATWVGRGQRSQDVAREGALGLLAQIDHPLATPTSRIRLVRLVTELGNGTWLTPRGRAELIDAVRGVMEPDSVFAASGLTRAMGPAQAPVTAEAVVANVESMNVAVQHTLRTGVDVPLLEQLRAFHRAATADYLADRPHLAAQAGGLADIFREPTMEQQINDTGRQLLYALGHLLLQRRITPSR